MTRKEDEWDCEDCQTEKDNTAKKDEIEKMLISIWASIGIDIPSNYEDIVQYCFEDVEDTADPDKWHSGDVAIAFRRWIEEQGGK